MRCATPRTARARCFRRPNSAKPKPKEEIRHNAEQLAREHRLEIEFIRSALAFRKDDRIRAILDARGAHPGLVHIFAAMEPCAAFTPWHDKATGTTTLRYKDGKCLHYYFYLIDEEFGLCYLRVPTCRRGPTPLDSIHGSGSRPRPSHALRTVRRV